MRILSFISVLGLALLPLTGHATEIKLFGQTLVLPGECNYEVKSVHDALFSCRSNGNNYTVAFKKPDVANQEIEELDKNKIPAAFKDKLKLVELSRKRIEDKDHAIIVLETKLGTNYNYFICGGLACISVMSFDKTTVGAVIGQLADTTVFKLE